MSISWDGDFNLDVPSERLRSAVPGALAAGMGEIVALATEKVPIESHNLQGSVDVTVHGNQAQITYPGPYARYQEFGVFYRHGVVGAPLNHVNGQSFFLTTSLAEGAEAAMRTTADMIARAL